LCIESSSVLTTFTHRTPKKPKSKKNPSTAQTDAGPSTHVKPKQELLGTKESPIALTSDNEDDRIGQKRKRYVTVVENGKKRNIVDVVSFWIGFGSGG